MPALIIAAILILAATVMARSFLVSYDRLGESEQARVLRLAEQAQTRLTIASASLNPAGDTLTAQLTNDGQTDVVLSDRTDLIVSYYTDAVTRLETWLPFSEGAPLPNAWIVSTISNDTFEPGILNPGETAVIEVELSPAVASSTTNRLILTTETGVTVSTLFTN